MKFKISSQYSPTGDQPQAIDQLVQGVSQGRQAQTLLGVTGSGKTFTMANVIERLQRPTLILSHNKTLAAQLYSEFKQFFPDNAVQYFVSYYDYYQPEAYIPSVDKYIEKDLMINDEIDRLRLATTSALLSGRRDVVVVSSVSCIYGMGNPEDFNENVVTIRSGQKITRNEFLRKLVAALYSRNEMDFQRGNFRVKGDTVDIRLAYEDIIVRVVFWGDEVEKVITIHPDDNAHLGTHDSFNIFPANLFVTSPQRQAAAIAQIQLDLGRQIEHFSKEARLLEAQRIEERVNYDVEMIKRTRILHRHRELLALFRRPPRGRPSFLPARLLPEGLPHDNRREPRNGAAAAGHVRGRPLPQGQPCGIRLPPACRTGQQAAEIRGIRGNNRADDICERHTGRL